MKVVRCPECGNRLASSYCPMCMKHVPFPSKTKGTPWQQRMYTPEREAHTCISFEETPKESWKGTNVLRHIGNANSQRKQMTNNKKSAKVLPIILAAVALVSSLAGIIDETTEVAPQPEYNYEAYEEKKEGFLVNGTALDEPVLVYNSDGLAITVDSVGNYYEDCAIAITIVNDSDRDVNVNTNLMCVNGYMFPYVSLYAPVEAGDSAQSFIQIPEYDLQMMDITQVSQIQFCLDITDSKSYDRVGYTDLITIEAEGFAGDTENIEYAGTELYNDGTVRIILRGTELSHYDDCTLKLYIENTGERTVCLSDREILLNGEDTSAMLWTQLLPHSRCVEDIYIYDMQEMGISRLEQIKEILIDLDVEYMKYENLMEWETEASANTQIVFCPAELE